MSDDKTPWTIWTNRTRENPRIGFGSDRYLETLKHLRRRGDVEVTVQWGEQSSRNVRLDSIEPLIVS